MRENRTYGSDGGEDISPLRPYQALKWLVQAIDDPYRKRQAGYAQQELAELEAWHPEIKDEEGVGTRVEWTIDRLKENNS